MMSSIPGRRFNAELIKLLDTKVVVKTRSGSEYTGTLMGYDIETLSLCLADVRVGDKKYHRVFISGGNLLEILKEEGVIDLKRVANEIEKAFPNMVEYYEEPEMIIVMKRVKVTRNGVEGTGPIAERVRQIYERMVKEPGV